MFVYQPTLDMFELKKYKVTDYVLTWKSWKLSTYRIGIKFNKDLLAVEQNNYTTKIVNVCIVHCLYAWPRNPTNNFKFKSNLFGTTNIVKSSDKEKYVYSGYGIIFDSAGSWSFDNNSERNVIIFWCYNSSLSHLTVSRIIFSAR